MKKKLLIPSLCAIMLAGACLGGKTGAAAGASNEAGISYGVPRDSIMLSDPCVLADSVTHTYYMTGTGGKVWKSGDLEFWDGPYTVVSGSCDMGCRNTSLQRQILLLCNFHQRFGHYSLQPQRCYTATRFAYIGVRHPGRPVPSRIPGRLSARRSSYT